MSKLSVRQYCLSGSDKMLAGQKMSVEHFWKCNFPMNHAVCPSVCLSACRSVCLSVGLSVGLSVCLLVCLSVGLSVQKKHCPNFLNVRTLCQCSLCLLLLLKKPSPPLIKWKFLNMIAIYTSTGRWSYLFNSMKKNDLIEKRLALLVSIVFQIGTATKKLKYIEAYCPGGSQFLRNCTLLQCLPVQGFISKILSMGEGIVT